MGTSPLELVWADLEPFLVAARTGLKIYGPDSNTKATTWPRITWRPDTVTHSPSERLGAGAGTGKSGSLWVREFRTFTTIWEESFTKAELLLAHFVDIAHKRLTLNGYRLDGEKWNTGEANTTGADVVLGFIVRIPFVRLEPTTATIEELQGEANMGGTPQVPIVIPPTS